MSKSVTQLNPKAKNRQEKSFSYLKVLIIIQFILTIGLIIFGIVTIFNTDLLYIFEIFLGITLLVMGLNNFLIYKRRNLTILYIIIGLGSIVLAILKLLGL